MKTFLHIALLAACTTLCTFDSFADTLPRDWYWRHVNGAPDANAVTHVRYDTSGNIFVVGWYTDSLKLSATNTLTAPSQIGYLAKYASDGTLQWARNIDTCYEALDLLINHRGLILVGGLTGNNNSVVCYYSSTGTFLFENPAPDGFHEMAMDSAGDLVTVGDGGVAYSNPQGALQWSSTGGNAVALDSAGSVYVANSSEPTGSIQKYFSDGTPAWNHSFDNNGQSAAVTCDDSGCVYLTAKMFGTPNFGKHASFAANYNLCTIKFDTAGAAIWGGPVTTTMVASDFFAATTDRFGEIYFACTTAGMSVFGTDTVDKSSSLAHIYFVHYSTAGVLQSVFQLANTTQDYNLNAFGLAVNTRGDIVVCGEYAGYTTFDSTLTLANGATDGFFGTLTFPPKISCPTSIHFPTIVCADNNHDTSFTISNSGRRPLIVHNIQLLNDSARTYSRSTVGTFTLAPDSAKSIALGYLPRVEGPDSAQLVVTSNAPIDSFVIKLSGRLELAHFLLQPDTLNLNLTASQDSAVADVVIHNTGLFPATGSISTAAPFSTSIQAAAIAAGESVVVHVTFTKPVQPGTYPGKFVFLDSVCGDEHLITLIGNAGPSGVRDGTAPNIAALSILPQPVADHAMITFRDAAGAAPRISIVDMLGRTCMQDMMLQSGNGFYQTALSTTALIAGIYVCEITSAQESTRQLFIVNK